MTSPHPAPADAPVGRYRLLARIGEGGMGVVHVAQGPDGKRVALKVLRSHVVGDAESRERLAREVASLRKVRSKHVAEILDAEPHGDAPYIVTRYVPGLSLHDTVRQEGPFAPADLAYAARHLLQAVRDVHAAGVLHRDIKPTNVVMEGRAPVLIDFGLARLAEDPRLTATGWLLGSPGYLAPEVLFGDDASEATDVHGWAATMVHAATGRSPYGDGHTMAILDRTRRGAIDLRGVPDPMRKLLAQCLALEVLDRPTTREVAAELDSFDADALATTAVRTEPRPVPPAAPVPAPPTQPWQLADHDRPVPEAPTRVVPAAVPPNPLADMPAPSRIAPVPRTRVQPAVAPTRVEPVTRPASLAPSHLTPPSRITAAPVPGVGGVGGPSTGAPRGVTAPSPARPPTVAQRWNQGWTQGSGERPDTAIRPIPQLAPLYPFPPRLSRADRLRRTLLLGGSLALVVTAFRAAPYLTLLVIALLALVTRGVSRAGEARHRRRMTRGTKWHDTPRSVIGYPWHVLRGAAGAVVLVMVAGVVSAAVVASLVLLGLRTPDALLAGGLCLGLMLWEGPGSARVRVPLGRAATVAARKPVATFVVAGLLVVAVVACVSAFSSGGVTWSPADRSPWRSLPDPLAQVLRR